jgi:hypothetical protein
MEMNAEKKTKVMRNSRQSSLIQIMINKRNWACGIF